MDPVAELAQAIEGRRLVEPALLMLELHRPLTTLAHAAALIAAPLGAMLVGATRWGQLTELLEHPEQVDRLIALLRESVERA